jgi:fucose 4-O-acetylase-like acetyltransferase
LNCAVAGFIFLAGYFTNIQDATQNATHFIVRKSKRVLIPYIFWTVFFILFGMIVYDQRHTWVVLMKIILLGKAAAPLYFCILYFFFILITPFVLKYMNNKIWNILFYVAMPAWFVIVYVLELKYSIPYSYWGILPVTWFLYYYLGLKMKDKIINLRIPLIIGLICLGYIIESVEAYVIFSFTAKSYFAVTPLRFSSFFYIMPIIVLFLRLKDKPISDKNWLVLLGNKSFGIFMFHMAVLLLVVQVLIPVIPTVTTIQYLLYVVIVFVVTLLITYPIISLCQRFIPKKILQWIGFI